MKSLIVEDDYITASVMQEILSAFGNADTAANGLEAIDLFKKSLDDNSHYDIIFLDIMMPELDGQETLTMLRVVEQSYGIMGLDAVKIIMTTALDDYQNIRSAFNNQCEGYIVKPIDKEKIINTLIQNELLSD